jgi:chemotaxis protein CheC
MTNPVHGLSAQNVELLQEVMNIAFGAATAELAEVIDIFVKLEVPVIRVLNLSDLREQLYETVFGSKEYGLVKQDFWGEFRGSALLVFPEGRGSDLIAILNREDPNAPAFEAIKSIEEGVLMELGNILIGACVAKISELLKTVVSFRPPTVFSGADESQRALQGLRESSQVAIIMKTAFHFTGYDIEGNIVVATDEASLGWLDQALTDFLEEF